MFILVILGLAVIGLWGYGVYVSYRFTHFGQPVKAQVTGTHADPGLRQLSDVTFTAEDGTLITTVIAGSYLTGQQVDCVWDPGHAKLMKATDVKSGQGPARHLILLFGLLLLCLAWVAYHMDKGDAQAAAITKALPPVIGALMMVVGLVILYQQVRTAAAPGLRKVTGTVVDILPEQGSDSDGGYSSVYRPVYAADIDGRHVENKSTLATSPCRLQVGQQLELLYDPDKDQLTRRSDMNLGIAAGVLCTLIGLVLLILRLANRI